MVNSTIHHRFLTPCRMSLLGAIGQSARSTDRAVLSSDCAALLKYLLVAQQSVDRATIGRSRNNRSITQQSVNGAIFGNEHAQSTDCAGMTRRDRPIVQERFCAIGRLCRNGCARSADCAGIVRRDRPIVQELFGAIG